MNLMVKDLLQAKKKKNKTKKKNNLQKDSNERLSSKYKV